jgi:hypothetical protein
MSRLKENMEVYDIKLTQEEYDSITKRDKNVRMYDVADIPYGLFPKALEWNNFPYYK